MSNKYQQRSIGARIRWMIGRKEVHGIVLKNTNWRCVKVMSHRVLMDLAKKGIIPKIVLNAKSDVAEGERVVNREGIYIVAQFVTEPRKIVSVKITTIPRDRINFYSDEKLDTIWVILAKKRYAQYQSKLRLARKSL